MTREFSQVQTPKGFESRCNEHGGNLHEDGDTLNCEIDLLDGGRDVFVMDSTGTVTLHRVN